VLNENGVKYIKELSLEKSKEKKAEDITD